jgi:hypothetical protein
MGCQVIDAQGNRWCCCVAVLLLLFKILLATEGLLKLAPNLEEVEMIGSLF